MSDNMPPSYPPEGGEGAARYRAGIEPAETRGEAGTANAKKSGPLSILLEFVTVIVIALLVAVVLKTFLIQAYEIPTGSMEDTLIPGDRIVVNKLADSEDELNRGDVVVFVDPGNWLPNPPPSDRPAIVEGLRKMGQMVGLIPQNEGDHLVKRIIGLPGDTISSTGEGPIVVNGVQINEPYLKPSVNPSDIAFEVTVPNGYMWVMGDNRSRSEDSRAHQIRDGFGFVPIANVEGRAWQRVYPLNRFGGLPDASQVFADVPNP